VLVVVEDRDLHPLAQRLLDREAFRRLDVLEIDPAEGGLERGYDLDQLLGVGLVDLDVEDVDAGELLEEAALALHHGLARQRSDVAEAQDRRAVADHRHKVALGGVIVGGERVLLDLETGDRDTRGIGQRQVALVGHVLGRLDRDLSRGGIAMIGERCLCELVFHLSVPASRPHRVPRRSPWLPWSLDRL
jgi:hypothetical protein